MRATASLVVAAVAAMVIAVGTGTPSGSRPSLVAAGPDATPQVLADGFDGLLYPDPDTGCIRLWREGDDDPATAEDIWGPRSAPPHSSVQVQGPKSSFETFGEIHRGPWPLCDEESLAGISDSES